jgi:hypothetical protein
MRSQVEGGGRRLSLGIESTDAIYETKTAGINAVNGSRTENIPVLHMELYVSLCDNITSPDKASAFSLARD